MVAHAVAVSSPAYEINKLVKDPEMYHWVFRITDIMTYRGDPVILDPALLKKQEAFKHKPVTNWGWFVQGCHRLSANDYKLLIKGT